MVLTSLLVFVSTVLIALAVSVLVGLLFLVPLPTNNERAGDTVVRWLLVVAVPAAAIPA